MRILVLLLALWATGINTFLGALAEVALDHRAGDLEPMKKPDPPPEVVAKYDALVRTAYLFHAMALLCAVGAFSVLFFRKGTPAAIVLLLATLCALVALLLFHSEAKPFAIMTAILTSIAGGLALWIKPGRSTSPIST
jgi:hypothetical protein